MPAAPQARPQADVFRLPLVSFGYFVLLLIASGIFYSYRQHGPAMLGSLICLPLALWQLKKSVEDSFRLRGYRNRLKRFRKNAPNFGQSRLATWQDIDRCEHLSETEGTLVGTFTDETGRTGDIRLPGQINTSITAPPGSGKTMAFICTAIFGGLGSFLCNDPSGEVLRIVRKFLERLGYKIIIVTPFIEDLWERTGMRDLLDRGIDVFSDVNREKRPHRIREKLEAALERVIPFKQSLDAKSKYFYRLARKICLHLGVRQLEEQGHVSLVGIREQLMFGMGNLSKLYFEDEEEGEGLVKELAQTLGGLLAKASPQYAGGYDIALQHLEVWDPQSNFGMHVTYSDLDPGIVKDPNQKVAIFVSYPPEYAESHEPQISMTWTHLLDSIAADKREGSCTVLADECGALNVRWPEKLDFYRRLGLKFELIFQDISGQAEAMHTKTGVKRIKNASQAKIGTNLVEKESLQEFSDMCGKRSVVKQGLNDRADMAQAMPDMAPGLNHESVPLIRPEEIRMLPSKKMILIVQNCYPILMDKLPYWERWSDEAGTSPFYRGDA